MIIEAAGGAVVPIGRASIRRWKRLHGDQRRGLARPSGSHAKSRRTGCRLYVPSGAIAGLDGIKSAVVGAITHVTHTTRKPPVGLEGAPYLVERGISLAGLQEEKEIFSGSAREACRGFPANVNVTAAVSLAGIGPDQTRVKIFAVPVLCEIAMTSMSKANSASCTCISKMCRAKIPRPESSRLCRSFARCRSMDPVRIGN